MQIDIQSWMQRLTEELRRALGGRLLFVGLQGSYGRGEATESSDIDAVVILDKLGVRELAQYKQILSQMPHREKICGFVSGKNELMHWEKADLFQFYHDTTPWFGRLEDFITPPGKADAKRAALVGACNIYHAAVHNYLHENDPGLLRSLFKAAFFVLQARHFYEKGVYIQTRAELLENLPEQERALIKNGLLYAATDMQGSMFEELSRGLIEWAGGITAVLGD